MRKLFGAASAALAIVIAPAALAQESAPTAHQLELARQIIDATGQRQILVGMMQNSARQIVEQSAKDLPADKQAASQASADALAAVYAKLGPKVLDLATDAYARTYSEEELTQILAFMQSPVGRAMTAKTPQMMQRVMSGTVALMPDVRRQYATEFCARTTCSPAMKALATGAKTNP